MARLIVEAVTGEFKGTDVISVLKVFVSVSRADDGKPVTGLSASNFRIASSLGLVLDPTVGFVNERNWEPGDSEPSGCYSLEIKRPSSEGKWGEGEYYAFGIQVRTLRNETPLDFGQTVVSVESFGT